MANKLHVKTGDQVIVVTGNAKGTIGKVVEVSPKEGKVIVEGANIVKKHVRPRSAQQQGGIVEARFSTTAPSARRLPESRTRSMATRKSASA